MSTSKQLGNVLSISKDEFKKALPVQIRKNVNDAVINDLNKIINNTDIREQFKENILSYTSVMKQGKYKIASYVAAVKYVSYKLLGFTNKDSYYKTFPHRVNKLVSEGASDNMISGYVAAYNKTKLVNLIFEQTLIPTYVLNADAYQKAINVQVDLMSNAKREDVRMQAANSLLIHLKQPEVAKVNLSITTEDNRTIDDLRDTIADLAQKQKELIANGAISVTDMAKSAIVIDHSTQQEVDESA